MAVSDQEFVETLGKVLDIIQQSPSFAKKVNAQRADSKKSSVSLNDFRRTLSSKVVEDQPGSRQDAQQLKELTRERRSLRISSNAYTSMNREIPQSMQRRLDDLDARIKELK